MLDMDLSAEDVTEGPWTEYTWILVVGSITAFLFAWSIGASAPGVVVPTSARMHHSRSVTPFCLLHCRCKRRGEWCGFGACKQGPWMHSSAMHACAATCRGQGRNTETVGNRAINNAV